MSLLFTETTDSENKHVSWFCCRRSPTGVEGPPRFGEKDGATLDKEYWVRRAGEVCVPVCVCM